MHVPVHRFAVPVSGVRSPPTYARDVGVNAQSSHLGAHNSLSVSLSAFSLSSLMTVSYIEFQMVPLSGREMPDFGFLEYLTRTYYNVLKKKLVFLYVQLQ